MAKHRFADATFLTPPGIARQLGVDPNKVLRWIRRGQLAAVNVSEGEHPLWRISPDDFARFLESRRAQPPAPQTRRPRKSAKSVTFF